MHLKKSFNEFPLSGENFYFKKKFIIDNLKQRFSKMNV